MNTENKLSDECQEKKKQKNLDASVSCSTGLFFIKVLVNYYNSNN